MGKRHYSDAFDSEMATKMIDEYVDGILTIWRMSWFRAGSETLAEMKISRFQKQAEQSTQTRQQLQLTYIHGQNIVAKARK
jgi:hypothetical protein